MNNKYFKQSLSCRNTKSLKKSVDYRRLDICKFYSRKMETVT